LVETLKDLTNETDNKNIGQVTGKSSSSVRFDALFFFSKFEDLDIDKTLYSIGVGESIEEITIGSSLQPALKRKKIASSMLHDNLLGISSPESDPSDSIPIDQIMDMDFVGGPTCATCHL
jgi:hypothetical protein